MNAKRVGLQIACVILAMLAFSWTLSLINVFIEAMAKPELLSFAHLPGLALAIVVTVLPYWGFIKITKILNS